MINMFPHPPLQLPDAPTQQWVKCLMTLTFDILTLKVVSESRVKWAISVPNLVFLGLCSQLRPDVRDRHQTSDKSITVTNCRRVAATICIHPSPSQWAPKRLSWLSIIFCPPKIFTVMFASFGFHTYCLLLCTFSTLSQPTSHDSYLSVWLSDQCWYCVRTNGHYFWHFNGHHSSSSGPTAITEFQGEPSQCGFF